MKKKIIKMFYDIVLRPWLVEQAMRTDNDLDNKGIGILDVIIKGYVK